jgi:hypothetical protein
MDNYATISERLSHVDEVQLSKRNSYINLLRTFAPGTKISSIEFWISTFFNLVSYIRYTLKQIHLHFNGCHSVIYDRTSLMWEIILS